MITYHYLQDNRLKRSVLSVRRLHWISKTLKTTKHVQISHTHSLNLIIPNEYSNPPLQCIFDKSHAILIESVYNDWNISLALSMILMFTYNNSLS